MPIDRGFMNTIGQSMGQRGLSIFFFFFFFLLIQLWLLLPILGSSIPCDLPGMASEKFIKKTETFWAFDRGFNQWKQVDIAQILKPFGIITAESKGAKEEEREEEEEEIGGGGKEEDEEGEKEKVKEQDIRRRLSLQRVSEASLWVSGESGSIYERFWNGLQWVIIPHDLPNVDGYAVGVLYVNQTMAALSEAGKLFQLQADSNGHAIWVHCGPFLPSPSENVTSSLLRPGAASTDGRSLYFATSDGKLAELVELHPVRWVNHGRPRGGDVAAVVDAGDLKPGTIFIVSHSGELYEFNPQANPSWKKHVREGTIMKTMILKHVKGLSLQGLGGLSCISLFLLTQEGTLVERRFHQRKWRWIEHLNPEGVVFSSLAPMAMNRSSKKVEASLFLTSRDGSVFEYRISELSSGTNSKKIPAWINHENPNALISTSVPGVSLMDGRFIFILDDGRLAELHLTGIGGEGVSPFIRSSMAKKSYTNFPSTYEWSILEVPESEGGNAPYCTLERGPSHCSEGTRIAITTTSTTSSTNQGTNAHFPHKKIYGRTRMQHNGLPRNPKPRVSVPWSHKNEGIFRIRTMQLGKSLFMIGEDGSLLERFFNEGAWIWLRHEPTSHMIGIPGTYDGSVYTVDQSGSLFIRERIAEKLHWKECMPEGGGIRVSSGPPWDITFGDARTAAIDDALFFVHSNGSLMEFIVAMRKFTWRDCGHPESAHVSFILDQESLRYRAIFTVGTDGRLYHFNRVMRNWYAHEQPSHIVLSQITGAVLRPGYQSMTGSLFMRSEDGGLIEFFWDALEGWVWAEHGHPEHGVFLSTAPGPTFPSGMVIIVGTNGHVYSRQYNDSRWKWFSHGYPNPEAALVMPSIGDDQNSEAETENDFDSVDSANAGPANEEDLIPFAQSNLNIVGVNALVSFHGVCDPKVASIRPVAFSKNSAVFMLKDGRLAELKQEKDGQWMWTHIVDTPTSTCKSSYWIASTS